MNLMVHHRYRAELLTDRIPVFNGPLPVNSRVAQFFDLCELAHPVPLVGLFVGRWVDNVLKASSFNAPDRTFDC